MSDQDDKDKSQDGDFLTAGPVLPDGRQLVLRHKEDQTVEMAELHPVSDGKPIPDNGELVEISGPGPRYKVSTLYKQEDTNDKSRKGPSRVSNDRYRTGWDEIFKPGAESKLLN